MKNKLKIKRLLNKTVGYLEPKDRTIKEIQSHIEEGKLLADEWGEALADKDISKDIYEINLKHINQSMEDDAKQIKERAPLERKIAGRGFKASPAKVWKAEEEKTEEQKPAKEVQANAGQVEVKIVTSEEKEAMYNAWVDKQAKERREGVANEIASAKIGADTSLERNSKPEQEIDIDIIKWMHNQAYEVKDGDKAIGSYKKDGDKLSYNSSGNEENDKLIAKAMVEHLLKISNPPITASGDEKLVNMVKDVCEKGTPKIDFVNGNENKAGHGMKK